MARWNWQHRGTNSSWQDLMRSAMPKAGGLWSILSNELWSLRKKSKTRGQEVQKNIKTSCFSWLKKPKRMVREIILFTIIQKRQRLLLNNSEQDYHSKHDCQHLPSEESTLKRRQTDAFNTFLRWLMIYINRRVTYPFMREYIRGDISVAEV